MENKEKVIKTNRILCVVFIILFGTDIVLSAIQNNPNSDAYFLVNTGKYIVENLQVPKTNVWTWHENFNTIVQQWLACVSNFIWFNALGNKGLVIMTLINTIIACILALKFMGLYTDNKKYKICALVVFMYIIRPFMNTRPTLITIPIILFELITLTKFERNDIDIKKYIIRMSIISLLLVNWHSSFWLYSFIIMLPFVVPAVWDIKNTDWNKIKHYLYSIPLMIICGLINPNGIESPLYLLKSYGSITEQIVILELRSPVVKSKQGLIILIAVALLTFYILKGEKIKGDTERGSVRDKSKIYLALGTLVLALYHIRNNWMLLFSIIQFSIILMDNLYNFYNTWKHSDKMKYIKNLVKENKLTIKLAFSFMLICTVVIAIFSVTYNSNETDKPENTKYGDRLKEIDKAVDYLNNLNSSDIKLYNEFAEGNYLELKGIKVYIDARPELYTPQISGVDDNIYKEYISILLGNADYAEILEKRNFTHLLISKDTNFNLYMSFQDNYKIVVETDTYNLYESID